MSEIEFSYQSQPDNDSLYTDGPLIAVEITVPVPLVRYLRKNNFPPYPIAKGFALIDTGAAVTAVDDDVLQQLAIPVVDTEPMQTVHGVAEMRLFNASVNFPGLGLSEVVLDRIPGGMIRSKTNTGADIIMLLGRDLLRGLKFTYDGPQSMLTITT